MSPTSAAVLALGLTLWAAGCTTSEPKAEGASETPDEPGDGDLTVTMEAPEAGYQYVTPGWVVPAHTEAEMCTIFRLEPHADEDLVWIDKMVSYTSEGSHHGNLLVGSFSFLDAFLGDGASASALGADVGQLPCAELDYMESAYTVLPGQRQLQEITFPDGVAAPLVVPLLAIFTHHYVNTSDQDLTVNAVLNFHATPAEEVDEVAALLFDAIPDLSIDPGTSRTQTRTCVTDREVDVVLVSTHNHEWGTCATLHHYEGSSGAVEAEPFFVNKNWEAPPVHHFTPGSFRLQPGDGVHYACHYDNDTDRELIDDGTADGEMCVFAAVVHPSTFGVADVISIVDSGDVAQMGSLLAESFGPCDSYASDAVSPWSDAPGPLGQGADTCAAFSQTESNTLD